MAPLQRVNDILNIEDMVHDSLRSVSSTETNTDLHPSKETLNRHEKKTVRFAQFSLMYQVPNLDSYTKQELEDSFLTEEDYDRVQMENEITLGYMNKGIYPDDDQLYFRGLETGMVTIYHQKKRHYAEAVLTLLRRQAEGKDMTDPAWTSAYHNRFSYQSMVNAFRIGHWDSQAAQKR